jgi:cell division transport system permease protein
MHFFFFREAWRSFKHHRGLAYTAIFSLTAALAVCGVFLVLAHNAELAMKLVGDRREMVVYLRDEITREQRDALMARMNELYGQVTYVSRDEAWKEFTEQVGDPALLEAVDGNPLPASLRVKLRPELLNFTKMNEAARQVADFPEVEDVRFGGEWVKRLDEIGDGLKRGALAVGSVVALAIVFVMYNTIRLTVMARRPQVEIMSRLGATDRFIATPFIVEAMLEATFASVLALAAVFGLQRAFLTQALHVAFIPWAWIGIFLGAAVCLAWLAAVIALSRVLRAVGA